MTDPITTEEDAGVLHDFNAHFREAIASHGAARLDLFFRLQFPDDPTIAVDTGEILRQLDMIAVLDGAIPPDIAGHPLTDTLRLRLNGLLDEVGRSLDAAAAGDLDAQGFKRLTAAMRRVDGVVKRFEAGISASLSDIDEVTGLLNRAALDRDFGRERAQAQRTGKPFCVAMIDADHFKAVNDTYGHGFGDRVLAVMADRFEASLRPRDSVYRYGGEEFLAVLPETSLDRAAQAMDRLRAAVSAEPIRDEGRSIVQKVSIGVAEVAGDETAQAALARADEALYSAKQGGRNRVVASPLDASPNDAGPAAADTAG